MIRPTMRGRCEPRSGSRRWRQATNHSKPRPWGTGTPPGLPEPGTSLRPHQGEEDDVADGGLVGEEHGETVDADPLPRRRRHAVLERPAVVLVVVHGLLGAARPGVDLTLETPALVGGIVQLG